VSGTPPAEQQQTVVILDFGSQYSQLIARRVRECGVYSQIVLYNVSQATVESLAPVGFILSGGPASVYEPDAPRLPGWLLEQSRPILGLCYGMEELAHRLGHGVASAEQREYGLAELTVSAPGGKLFEGLPSKLMVWMSHGDQVQDLPKGFRVLAHTSNTPIAAFADERRRIYGLQFHPEVKHTAQGLQILRNFLFGVCECRGDWRPASFVTEAVGQIQQRIGASRAICALSGGVDSTVAATLVHRAIGERLTCVFVDHGLLRQGEAEHNLRLFQDLGLRVVHVDAGERFLRALKGIIDPEQKRRIIGHEFIRVFEAQARKLGEVGFLVQGTLYPDVIESNAADTKAAAKIKTHHNVGGLPADMKLMLVEPLRYLFKDEVRRIGQELGLPEAIVRRQPFPGPGLAVRIVGEVTPERLSTLRAADSVVTTEVEQAGLNHDIWQYFAVLTSVHTVGVMGDGRTYGNAVAVRAVTSDDGMTADWARLPAEVLGRISRRIVNEVPGVNRVVYDVTSKPPSTIEWE